MLIKGWTDRQNVAYPYNGIFLIHENQGSNDTYYNIHELQKHAKWKKSDTKHHLLDDSIYMQYSEQVNL